MVNSNRKGKDGEREVAELFRAAGFTEARRGQQFSGTPDSPDVYGIPGYHHEVKFVEHLNIHEAMNQAITDAGEYKIPTVIHRKKRTEWLVTMRFSDWVVMAIDLQAEAVIR